MFQLFKQRSVTENLLKESTHASMVGYHEKEKHAVVQFVRVVKCHHCHRDCIGPRILQAVNNFPRDVHIMNPRVKLVDTLELPRSFRCNHDAVDDVHFCLSCLRSGHSKL